MLYRCYAKVNLTLEVLGRRDDGFHDLASLVHTVSLADDLRVEAADQILTWVEGIEALENNLVTRAAHLLASTTSTRSGAELTLVKRIPTAAGLGGGSSDAATTLVALDALWSTRLGYQALEKLAGQLGSDVPFFLRGGAAIMRGRGDVLQPLPAVSGQWLVLAVPAQTLPDKTATLYAALAPSDFSTGSITEAVAARLQHSEPLAGAPLVNAFTRAARDVFPRLRMVWAQLEERCGRQFHLSGAGPALFSLAGSRSEATTLVERIAGPGVSAHTARTVRSARRVLSQTALNVAQSKLV